MPEMKNYEEQLNPKMRNGSRIPKIKITKNNLEELKGIIMKGVRRKFIQDGK